MRREHCSVVSLARVGYGIIHLAESFRELTSGEINHDSSLYASGYYFKRHTV